LSASSLLHAGVLQGVPYASWSRFLGRCLSGRCVCRSGARCWPVEQRRKLTIGPFVRPRRPLSAGFSVSAELPPGGRFRCHWRRFDHWTRAFEPDGLSGRLGGAPPLPGVSAPPAFASSPAIGLGDPSAGFFTVGRLPDRIVLVPVPRRQFARSGILRPRQECRRGDQSKIGGGNNRRMVG